MSRDISPIGLYRIENFSVSVRKSDERLADFPDEAVLDVTYNGRQFTPLSFTEEEARKVVVALSEHFGFNMPILVGEKDGATNNG